ncbi:MAG: hypothetical protein KTV77_01680 [Wolbachia endosymbiont of Fragariocoptes setiger]|nr:hypothetical protein [Wolbachia endosymbiont of Fragariocoptes setiger]
MSKLQLKIKDTNNHYVTLRNIKNLRFTLHNYKEEIEEVSSFGWKRALNYSGNRYILVKINGILDCMLADKLLNDYEMNCNASEKINLRCSIELYERYYDSSTFDSFTVILTSVGAVNILH